MLGIESAHTRMGYTLLNHSAKEVLHLLNIRQVSHYDRQVDMQTKAIQLTETTARNPVIYRLKGEY